MIKYNKPTIALCLVIQSLLCLALNLIMTSRKRHWANVMLILSAIGAGCAAYLLWQQSLENKITARRKQNAMDLFCDVSTCDDFDIPDFDDLEIDEADIPLA